MQSERIYLVWAHPCHDSLTANIADAIHQRAMERKIQVTELDLYRRNFNPVMTPEDEPDWKNMDKRYSPEVHQLYSELLEHDTLVVVFPLWWYSFPAMLKGYIDRVWNNGLAYGDGHKLPFNKVRWVALVGGDKESFVQMGWEKNISDYLKNMCSYLGIEDADVTFLCNTVVFDGQELHASYYQSLLSQVRDMVDAL
ncbi:NAD(P)H oxidoreductase [Escherichia coli]